MAKHDAAALRAARMERLARRTAATGEKSEKEDKSQEQSAEETKEATVSASPVLTAAVLDPTTVSRTAQVDLVGYTDAEDPFWVVLANGRPVAEIRLSDQEDDRTAAFEKMFTDEQYAEGVREAARSFDLAEVLAGVRARLYQASVSGDDAYKSIEARLRSESSAALREARANLRDNFANMLNLVVLAQTKNFLRENPLKDELCNRLTMAGMDEHRAVAVIEAAYQARGPEHFDHCFKQASKWMDLTPQALNELEEQIKDLGYRQPHIAETDEIRAASAEAPQSHNVPFQTRTVTAAAGQDEKEAMRESLGFRRRNRNHQIR